MRRLYIEILVVCTIFTLVIIMLEKKYSSYQTKADEMMSDFFTSSENAEVLLVGNSHMIAVYEGLKDRTGDRISLLGLGGLDIFQMRNLTIKYAYQMKNLKLMVISADEYCLGNNLKTSNFLYVDRMLYRYTDTLYEQSFSSALMAKSNFMRSNRDFSFLFSSAYQKKKEEEELFLQKDPLSPANCLNRSIELTEKRFRKNLYDENSSLFIEMLNDAISKGIRVVVVSLPKSNCYNRNKNSVNTSEGSGLISGITKEENIPYYNLTNIDSMDDSQFRDADHMNKKGASSFIMMMDTLLRRDGVVSDFASMVLNY